MFTALGLGSAVVAWGVGLLLDSYLIDALDLRIVLPMLVLGGLILYSLKQK